MKMPLNGTTSEHQKRSERLCKWQRVAKQYLQLFGLGLSSSFSMIAPAGADRFRFLSECLIPSLREHGYIVVFTKLGDNPDAPHLALLESLERSIRDLDEGPEVTDRSIKLHEPVISAAVSPESDRALETTPAKNMHLLLLDDYMSELEHQKSGRTILIVDNFDRLADSPAFDSLTYALRTQLDKRRGTMLSLLVGSSNQQMSRLLKDRRSAFYHFATDLPAPEFCLKG